MNSWFKSTAPVPILTPCIGICTLRADGLCAGCLRTGNEIAAWGSMSDSEKRQLMEQVLPQRSRGGA